MGKQQELNTVQGQTVPVNHFMPYASHHKVLIIGAGGAGLRAADRDVVVAGGEGQFSHPIGKGPKVLVLGDEIGFGIDLDRDTRADRA